MEKQKNEETLKQQMEAYQRELHERITQPPRELTLLDYFAAMALQGMLSARAYSPDSGWTTTDFVKSAYLFGETMVKEREKRNAL